MARRRPRPNLNKPRRPDPDLGKNRPDPRPNNRNDEFPWPEFTDPLENHEPLWPNSPLEIGGGDGDIEDFLTTTPIGYEVEIVKGTCEIGIRATPVLVFMNLPPLEIIYRIPGCREPEPIEPFPPINFPDLPPEPPIWPGDPLPPGMYVEVITNIPPRFPQFDDEPAIRANCIHQWMPERELARLTGDISYGEIITGDTKWIDRGWGFSQYVLVGASWQFQGYSSMAFLSYDPIQSVGNFVGVTDFIQRFDPNSDRLLFVRWEIIATSGLKYIVSPNSRWATPHSQGTSLGRGHQLWLSASIETSYQHLSVEKSVSDQAAPIGRYRGTVEQLTEYLTHSPPVQILGVWTGSACLPVPAPPKFAPPPPPPPNALLPPPMKNCPCQHNDRLLKDLLARIQKIEQTVGAPLFFDDKAKQLPQGKLPFAPERLIYPKVRGDRKKHPLHNLVELLEFQIRQVDRAVGDLPITIKIKDADPSREGDQKVEAEFHSLGSALKEITELGIESGGDVDLQTLMLCRILYECGFIHQGSIQSQYILEAIADWLDFPVKYKTKKFPFAFNPRVGIELGKGFGEGQDQGDVPDTEAEFEKIAPRLLKETDTPIKVMELSPKQKTTHKDAIDEIQRLVRVAAAAAGQEATPENLDNLINVARLALKMDGLLRREDYRKAATQASKPQGG